MKKLTIFFSITLLSGFTGCGGNEPEPVDIRDAAIGSYYFWADVINQNDANQNSLIDGDFHVVKATGADQLQITIVEMGQYLLKDLVSSKGGDLYFNMESVVDSEITLKGNGGYAEGNNIYSGKYDAAKKEFALNLLVDHSDPSEDDWTIEYHGVKE